ncbi:MCE family protein [Christiangramia fulva]|uniref:MCE family protein n=1 Tax=Christiangramia fulva TaxID=2126553 RepID=A0A2R3ZB17_9FLAO|nr:MlaD family protein [Christiangramia fulva]AVR47488.1 MCE family protein [Christiangramia fulva]
MKYSREVKTAVLAITAIVLLIVGYSFLKGQNLLEDSRTFYAVYDDVEGLSPSSEVTINGLKVGQVTKIDFLNQKGQLLVTFTVKNDFAFSENSIAEIYGGNIIGGKSLAIIPKYDKSVGMAESGDTLQGKKEEGLMELVNDRLSPLQEKLENTIVSADSMVTAIAEVLNDSTRRNIRGTFKNLDATVASFRQTANELHEIVSGNSDKLDRTFTNLDEMSANFNNFSDTLSQMNLKQMTTDLENVVADFQQIADKLNNGEGTAGKLLNDETVYNNLDRATRQLEELLQDVKLNPKRYVHFSIFGKNPEPYEEEE